MKREIKNPCNLVQFVSRVLRPQVFTESLSIEYVCVMVVDVTEGN
jgi:hypothetical protein